MIRSLFFSGKNGDSISTKVQILDLQVTNLAISHARVCQEANNRFLTDISGALD